MRSKPPILCLVFSVLTLMSAQANEDAQADKVIEKLGHQLAAFSKASALIERPEIGRYKRLWNVAEQVVEKLKMKGPLNPETTRALRKYSVVFAKAENFLGRVKSEKLAGEIDQILRIYKDLAAALQISVEIYTYNTSTVLDEFVSKINDAISQNPPKYLRDKLEELKLVDIPSIKPKSEATGDSFKTYKAAIPVCHKIRALYPAFYAIADTTTLYAVLMDIQGINEEYIELTRIEEEVAKLTEVEK
ncbi:MAG: hypothetical protein HYR96_01055 [Deltaproteobacteria bacterium]|nr:hypothetical protein [Deltaproteobacteria bacterium]MBI3293432.1 hypothetical protein [Deltaproteobacteria bacterium]